MSDRDIKAIETEWNGVMFRSRLEARWAMLFDIVGIEWKYEPEGYKLPSGWYVPDFLITFDRKVSMLDEHLQAGCDPDGWMEQDAYFEVKPPDLLGDARKTWFRFDDDADGVAVAYRKCHDLYEATGVPVFIGHGYPHDRTIRCIHRPRTSYPWGEWRDWAFVEHDAMVHLAEAVPGFSPKEGKSVRIAFERVEKHRFWNPSKRGRRG